MKVAVAIITDEQHRILITQRPAHVPHGGCWEFPGGKVDGNELAEQALIREIREEVGLEILEYKFLGQINHQYSDKSVQLLIFHVIKYTGTARCLEGQPDMKWIEKDKLHYYEFPEANLGVFDLIPVSESV